MIVILQGGIPSLIVVVVTSLVSLGIFFGRFDLSFWFFLDFIFKLNQIV